MGGFHGPYAREEQPHHPKTGYISYVGSCEFLFGSGKAITARNSDGHE